MTKKFKYTDNATGRQEEAAVYTAAEFTFISAPNSPLLTGPDGKISNDVLPAILESRASSLATKRKLSEPVVKGQPVYPTSSGYVGLADPNDTKEKATALGLALDDGDTEDEIFIVLAGPMTDPSFNIFAQNAILFLDEDGGITDERPTFPSKKYLVVLGKYIGGGEVLVSIQPAPTKLG